MKIIVTYINKNKEESSLSIEVDNNEDLYTKSLEIIPYGSRLVYIRIPHDSSNAYNNDECSCGGKITRAPGICNSCKRIGRH